MITLKYVAMNSILKLLIHDFRATTEIKVLLEKVR